MKTLGGEKESDGGFTHASREDDQSILISSSSKNGLLVQSGSEVFNHFIYLNGGGNLPLPYLEFFNCPIFSDNSKHSPFKLRGITII